MSEVGLLSQAREFGEAQDDWAYSGERPSKTRRANCGRRVAVVQSDETSECGLSSSNVGSCEEGTQDDADADAPRTVPSHSSGGSHAPVPRRLMHEIASELMLAETWLNSGDRDLGNRAQGILVRLISELGTSSSEEENIQLVLSTARCLLGRLHMHRNQYHVAQTCFQEVVRSPASSRGAQHTAWTHLGSIASIINRPKDTLLALRMATEYASGANELSAMSCAGRFSQIGAALFQLNQPVESIKYHQAEMHNLMIEGRGVLEVVRTVFRALSATGATAAIHSSFPDWLLVLMGNQWRCTSLQQSAAIDQVIVNMEGGVHKPAATPLAISAANYSQQLQKWAHDWSVRTSDSEAGLKRNLAAVVTNFVNECRSLLACLARSSNNLANAYLCVSKASDVCARPKDAEQLSRMMFRACIVLNELIGQKCETAKASINLGVCLQHSECDQKEAGVFFRRGIAILERSGDVLSLARALGTFGGYLIQRGELDESHAVLSRGVAECERALEDVNTESRDDAWKGDVLSVLENCYNNMMVCLVEKGQFEEALLVCEQGRARTVADRLLKKTSATSAQPDTLSTSSSVSMDEIYAAASRAGVRLVEYAVVSVPTPSKVQSELFTWVIQPDGQPVHFTRRAIAPVLRRITSRITGDVDQSTCASIGLFVRQLQELMAESVSNHGNKPRKARLPATLHQMLYALYKLLIADIEPQLEGAVDVVFVPHQELLLVPFHALYGPRKSNSFGHASAQVGEALDYDSDGEDEVSARLKGVYLTERFSCTVSPSVRVFARRHALVRKSSSATSSLLVGNPKSSKAALLHAEREVQFVAKKVEASDRNILIGSKASKAEILSRFAQAKYNHVHLATHGTQDSSAKSGGPSASAEGSREATQQSKDRIGSGVLLGDDKPLVAKDISDLDLRHIQLTVLSACETGSGEINADGVLGLVRGLLAAGVSRTISSLWSVDDLAATVFMLKFYTLLSDFHDQSYACVHTALRQTRQWMIRATLQEVKSLYEKCILDKNLAASCEARDAPLPMLLRSCASPPKSPEFLQWSKMRPFCSPGHWAAFNQIGFGDSGRCTTH